MSALVEAALEAVRDLYCARDTQARMDARQRAWDAIEALAAALARSERRAQLVSRGGVKGGHARAAALSPARRAEIARIAANARWGNTVVAEAVQIAPARRNRLLFSMDHLCGDCGHKFGDHRYPQLVCGMSHCPCRGFDPRVPAAGAAATGETKGAP